MQKRRIIPCLDVLDGRVVKGINFVNIKDVGDPAECARIYDEQGADEVVFLDINATYEGRGIMEDVLRRTVKGMTVPLTVGGGIQSVDDFERLLLAGASKISVNSAAVRNPELISRAAAKFGSGCVVAAIDARRIKTTSDDGHPIVDGIIMPKVKVTVSRFIGGVSSACDVSSTQDEHKYSVLVNGGRVDTGMDLIEWAKKVEELGAGEILLTSMDADGTKAGFDLDMLNAVCSKVSIPVIASGGCGSIQDFIDVFTKTGAQAALAASVFHYGEFTVGDVKKALSENGIYVNI